ncbi:MAG: TVP38/TMEM64 family protein [Candidatus Poseidoniaceae archaeon]|jgi:uncharacterized membrane protein YdjX (TVP38/TMEM64 family)|nr:TVP38/TMEM64 family protein [Candidatus Poseidoniaceae archaeon]
MKSIGNTVISESIKHLPKPGELHLVDDPKTLKSMKEKQPQLYRWRALFGVIMLLVCAVSGYFLFSDAEQIIDWFRAFGLSGALLFTLMLSLAIILLLPTPFVKIGAGAIFPFWIAVVVNFAASMLGGLCAFLLGRWLFRETIQESIKNDKKMQNIEKAINDEAMKISILVRLSPILPDEWLNYIMSATPVSLRVFLISNTSSLIYCAVYSYYGHVLGTLALSSSGIEQIKQSPMGLITFMLGVLATVVATIIVTRVSIKALKESIGEDE